MRFLTRLSLVLPVVSCFLPNDGCGQESSAISLATHTKAQSVPASVDLQTTERIKKIVLNQGDDARALANLVQLTRKLPSRVTSQLYYDLAIETLQRGKYNQAANVLQQLLNQHPDQPVAGDALVTLVRLYSSSEVTFTENLSKSAARTQEEQLGLLKYALYSADRTLQKNSALADHPALTFQRAVATRLGGNPQAAQGRLLRLKRNAQAQPWRSRALAESWLQGKREDQPPVPVVVCHRAFNRPHLDGLLEEPLWQSDGPVQFSYDDGFLYLAISYPQATGQIYEPTAQRRTYDADLTGHDQLRLRLDLDRDYATCFEWAVDHRGQTGDRCWHDASWNLQWYIAAGGDDSHWTIEGAIPWESLTHASPRSGEAWAVAWERVLPGPDPSSSGEETPASEERFSLLLFE